jgi:hypothetical protein
MSNIFSPADQLSQIHELNRLFLGYLHQRACEGVECLGMSERVRALLRAVDPQSLDRAAEFPRSLFDVVVPRALPAGVADPEDSVAGRSLHALNLTILLSAWNLSRASEYYARLFLGLRASTVDALRAKGLSELPVLALAEGTVRCAFARSDSLWRELLFDDRPEVRHRLGLIALQPRPAGDSRTRPGVTPLFQPH